LLPGAVLGGTVPEARIEFTLGVLSFSGEGEQDWLAAQLEMVLQAAPELATLAKAYPLGPGKPPGAEVEKEEFTETLASHIRAKGGDTNQVKRFLATADWLRRRGSEPLTTAAVTKALSDNQQKRLANPADCLNKNVAKGFCEKKGEAFVITPDGLKALGYGDR
jgi:hypothetical protein